MCNITHGPIFPNGNYWEIQSQIPYKLDTTAEIVFRFRFHIKKYIEKDKKKIKFGCVCIISIMNFK